MALGGGTLRPLNFGEVLDVSFKLYGRNFTKLIPVVLVVLTPIQILSGLILLSTLPDPDLLVGTTDLTGVDGGEIALYYAGQLVSAVLLGLSIMIVTAALVRAYGEAYLGRTPSWKESLNFAAKRFGTLLWVSILVGLGLLVGLLVCLVGALFPYTAWAVAFPVIVVEGLRGSGALGRSWALVKPHFWWVLGLLVVAFLIVFVAQFFIGIVLGVVIFASVDSVAVIAIITTIANLVAYVVTTPFSAAVSTVLYFDLRVKNEGFDMQLLAQSLDAQDGAPPMTQPPPPPPAPA